MKGCRALTEQEVIAVASSFTGRYATRDRALFLLGVKSGFRISELLSLRIRDVWHANRVVERIYIERRNMKKKREGRTLPLNPKAGAALAEWLEELGDVHPDTHLFGSRKGNGPIGRVQAYRILRRAFDSAGVQGKLGTHSMRKTFARRVYDGLGGDLLKTQTALGHKSVATTADYLSVDQVEIDGVVMGL